MANTCVCYITAMFLLYVEFLCTLSNDTTTINVILIYKQMNQVGLSEPEPRI